MNNYYVYIYYNPADNIPFYVGMGRNDRYLSHLKEAQRNEIKDKTNYKLNTIRKILKDGNTPIIKIIYENLNKETACELEIFLISEIGRADKKEGPLTNLTMGGDGNRDWTPKDRENISKLNKNMIMCKDMKTGQRDRVHNKDPRWLSGELVGIRRGVECHKNTKKAASLTHKGVPKTKEHNIKNSESMKLLK